MSQQNNVKYCEEYIFFPVVCRCKLHSGLREVTNQQPFPGIIQLLFKTLCPAEDMEMNLSLPQEKRKN